MTKQKNPLRIEQGRKLVEYNRRKKEELKHLNEQITKQDSMDHKPKPDTNTYVYFGGLSVFGLEISRYLLYSKFKKQEQNLIDVPPSSSIEHRGMRPFSFLMAMLALQNAYLLLH